MKKDPTFHHFNLNRITNEGLELSLIVEIGYTKLPLPFMWLTVDVPMVQIVDYDTNLELAKVYLDSPVTLDGLTELTLKQKLKIEVCDNVPVLSSIVRKVLIGHMAEIDRLTLRLNFIGSFSLMGLMNIDKVKCGKTINFGDMKEQKAAFREHKRQLKLKEMKFHEELEYCLMTNVLTSDGVRTLKDFELDSPIPVDSVAKSYLSIPSIPSIPLPCPDFLKDLFPYPEITPFVYPNILCIDAGLDVTFSKPPGFNFKLGTITYQVLCNGHKVARCKVSPCEMSQLTKWARFSVQITPIALTHPVVGSYTTFRSVLRGTLSGTYNGVVYGEWGAESTIIGIKKVTIENENNEQVQWLTDLLHGLEVEYDIDAIRLVSGKAIEKTHDLSDAMLQLTAGVIQAARCNIM
ncbi:hypothetical protein HDV02_002166 [Globomyces sp. JEL0801]|nr:hypothetical protein HDV02_002166 [Globomyces sp. JEL0801]